MENLNGPSTTKEIESLYNILPMEETIHPEGFRGELYKTFEV